MATSNVSPECKKCGAPFKKKKKGTGKNTRPGRDVAPFSSSASPIKPPIPAPAGGYTITVDFAPYPTLHASLVALAKEQVRRPEDQLLYMFKEELEEKEKEARS